MGRIRDKHTLRVGKGHSYFALVMKICWDPRGGSDPRRPIGALGKGTDFQESTSCQTLGETPDLPGPGCEPRSGFQAASGQDEGPLARDGKDGGEAGGRDGRVAPDHPGFAG